MESGYNTLNRQKHDPNNESIVYLVECENKGDGEYANVLIAFRDDKSLDYFLDSTHFVFKRTENVNGRGEQLVDDSNPKASVIEIKYLKINKRLRRRSYYSLNLELLKNNNIEIRPVTDSFLIGAEIDNVAPINGSDLLLDTHGPLLPLYEEYSSRQNSHATLPWMPATMSLVIYDVKQACLFELRDNETERSVMFFDFGYYTRAKKHDVQNFLSPLIPRLERHKPILILSHFDLDHYHCLLALNSQGSFGKYFSSIIAPVETKTKMATDLVKQMRKDLGQNFHQVSILKHKRVKGQHPRMRLFGAIPGLKVYKGDTVSNINNCGIMAFVYGLRATALLTGDGYIVQSSDILNYEYRGMATLPSNNILTVPHHGGLPYAAEYRSFTAPPNMKPQVASISVNNALYPKHPHSAVIAQMKTIYPVIERTDRHGDLIYQL